MASELSVRAARACWERMDAVTGGVDIDCINAIAAALDAARAEEREGMRRLEAKLYLAHEELGSEVNDNACECEDCIAIRAAREEARRG